jgi:hypothetical protein
MGVIDDVRKWLKEIPPWRIIALTAMVAGLSMTAQAADATLTLACQGTTTSGTDDAKPEPISMGIIVDFTNRTVSGFAGLAAKITAIDDVSVNFSGLSGITGAPNSRITFGARSTASRVMSRRS